MKFFLLPVAIFAASALAQDKDCAANYIVEACLGSENAKLASCGTNDYVCRCAAYANILTCFNNCPQDTRQHDVAGQQTIFCGYASQFPSSTTKPGPAATGTGPSSAETTDSASNKDSEKADASGSAATSRPSTVPGSGASRVAGAGGVLAALAGVVAALL